jgi:predicted alpha-1,2-mannosidase
MYRKFFHCLTALLVLISPFSFCEGQVKSPVDYVNPYMGNISHLLVPTYPTVHLPNSLLRIYPERADYTSDQITGLPVAVTSHRGSSAFNLSPVNGTTLPVAPIMKYTYDQEKIMPYRYSVYLDEENIAVDFAPSHQSGIYSIRFEKEAVNRLVINTRNGTLTQTPKGISGYQRIGRSPTLIYFYLETEQPIVKIEQVGGGSERNEGNERNEKNERNEGNEGSRRNDAYVLTFNSKQLNLRYGISFISAEQAEKNLKREINTYDLALVASAGRDVWNKALSKIEVEGDCDDAKTLFYTSLYRVYERMICISEDGKYYSGIDNQVHDDNGIPFYTDDWVWDTYRAAHPLRILIEPETEINMINSYLRMAQQSKEGWMPTFPEVTGDSHRMNCNHAVAVVWDAYNKGLRGFDLKQAYSACKKAIMESSLIPWVRTKAGVLDDFYKEKGYFPALRAGEKETVREVASFEKRQSVAVTTGTAFDYWCLSQIAKELGQKEDYRYFLTRSYNYRNLYHEKTGFFHPKDSEGKFIEPFDYRFSGGLGARDYYDENNGWTYRWEVQHNPADLIRLMGSSENFIRNLNQTFQEPLGKGKSEFYAQLPDQTGNVGQFSMANEPSLHIPYLYNYAGQPWMTQKRIRQLIKEWFRNDLMGVPGDEDGGGMSAFVVFSQMGFYPVTPGLQAYNIGSPAFSRIKINLGKGRYFEIEAVGCSENNKYIQSATLNGKKWNKPWFEHKDLANGGKLILVMGDKANKTWGSGVNEVPPSAEKLE